MASGATASHIRAGILKETLILAAAGLAVGLAASLALSQALVSLLFGIERTDPVTLGSVLLLVGAVALLGGYLPALRASRTDPIQSLRGSK